MRPARPLTQRLDERPLLSVFVALHDPSVVGLLAATGVESVVIDQEHGAMGPAVVRQLVLAAHAAGVYAVVRCSEIRRSVLQDALEAGADGVLVPMVDCVEQARAVVEWCRYPPEGTRGFHPVTGASAYGARPGGADVRNREVFVAVQVETAAALEAVDAIARVPGLDALFLGPGDLALSLGVGADDPALSDALGAMAVAAARHGKLAGTFVMTRAQARDAVGSGARWLVASGDGVLLQDAGRRLLTELGPALG